MSVADSDIQLSAGVQTDSMNLKLRRLCEGPRALTVSFRLQSFASQDRLTAQGFTHTHCTISSVYNA